MAGVGSSVSAMELNRTRFFAVSFIGVTTTGFDDKVCSTNAMADNVDWQAKEAKLFSTEIGVTGAIKALLVGVIIGLQVVANRRKQLLRVGVIGELAAAVGKALLCMVARRGRGTAVGAMIIGADNNGVVVSDCSLSLLSPV
jgi:hypothetical protein